MGGGVVFSGESRASVGGWEGVIQNPISIFPVARGLVQAGGGVKEGEVMRVGSQGSRRCLSPALIKA